MWPQSAIVTAAAAGDQPRQLLPALGRRHDVVGGDHTSAGQRTLRAASGPDVQAAQAARSACSTPGPLRANSASVPPVIHRPGAGIAAELGVGPVRPRRHHLRRRARAPPWRPLSRSVCTGIAAAVPTQRDARHAAPACAAAASSAIAAAHGMADERRRASRPAASSSAPDPAAPCPATRRERRPLGAAMPRQVDGQHGVPVPGEPARRQLPDRVVAAGAVHEHHRRLGRIERPPARSPHTPCGRRPSAPSPNLCLCDRHSAEERPAWRIRPTSRSLRWPPDPRSALRSAGDD